MDLLSFPDEPLINIIVCLSPRDILAFCRASKRIEQLRKKSSLLQYIIALFKAGMEDNDPPFLSGGFRDRLDYLTRREEIWRMFDLSEERKIVVDVVQQHSHIRNYSAGVFMLGDLGSDPENLRTNGMKCIRMPSCLHRNNSASGTMKQGAWRCLPLGVDALGIGIALEESDLIVLLSAEQLVNNETTKQFTLHFKQFSNGNNHPLAQQSSVHVYDYDGEDNQCVTSIEISGKYLVLLLSWLGPLSEDDDRLYVYEWTTGTRIEHVTRRNRTYRGIVFVSADTFIATNLRDKAIEVVTVSPSATTTQVQWMCALALPEVHDDCFISSMTCRTDAIHPATGVSSTDPNGAMSDRCTETPRNTVLAGAGIHCQVERSLVEFRMYLQRIHAPAGDFTCFTFVTHRQSLLERAREIRRDGNSEEGISAVTVPWDDWGPKATRWSGADEPDARWTSSVAGQRHIFLTGERPQAIRVRNFNPLAIRCTPPGSRALMESPVDPQATVTNVTEESATTVTVVTEVSITPHQGCFKNDIRSSLPYIESMSSEGFDYDGVLIDEDHVIGLMEDEDGSLRKLEVFVMSPEVPSPCDCSRKRCIPD